MKERLMKRIFLVLTIGIIITAIIVVAKRNKGNVDQINQVAEEKQYGTELRIGINVVDTFDPLLSTNKNVQDVCKLIYEPLITLEENFKAKGVLAEEWAETAENDFIIKLKQGIKWHNGNEFTSSDVEFSIKKIQQANSSAYKDNIKNISNIIIIDKYTIKLELSQRESFFEYNLIFPIEEALDYQNGNPQLPSGTGMYKIYQITADKIELVRNQYKQDIESVQIKSITIKKYPTMGEAYNDFKIGNIDIIHTDSINYTNYIGTLGYDTKNFYGRKFNFLAMNTGRTALSNIEVRRAISYAIDKNMINSNIFNNKYYVANYPLNYGNWLYNDNTTSAGYNPEQSRKILQDNGWEYKNGTWQKNISDKNIQLVFNLIVNNNNSLRVKVAENIKQQLEDVGIKVNIVKVSSIQSYIDNKNYDLALIEMDMSVNPSMQTFYGEDNLLNYKNEEVLNISQELKEIKDEKIIKEKYNKILEIYKADVPYISLYFTNSTLIYSSKIIGNINPNWYNLYYNIENWKIEI